MRPNSIFTLAVLGLSKSVLSNPASYPRQAATGPAAQTDGWNPWERINRNDSALLIVDHQIGLFQLSRDWDHALFKRNMIAYAELGRLYNLPVIMTTSAETGPNGPLPKEVVSMFPDAPLIKRNGEINAWDDPKFREAVQKTGKKQLIVAGIVTDVCTAFLALSLRSEGYSVFADVEASGTMTPLIRDTANLRMQAAGVHLVSTFAIMSDLQRDWRNTNPSASDIVPYIDQYLPAYGMMMRSHAAALLQNGTVFPGSETLI
ncbi:unnamed protein product [Periconia digitata]|uniref:Isochorismatase-like domain-containing protein n=1 Tax=Periconia digitata TaxID=1303443 RepID=A0A9W4UW60_9PLEO|nr:unnamed protein product [Periconia digitata]